MLRHDDLLRVTGLLPVIKVELLEPYEMGHAIGKRFASMIQERINADPYLQTELLPFAGTTDGVDLIERITSSNKKIYPRYWDELRGMADGSGIPFLEVLLLNFRKEVSPFLPTLAAEIQTHNAEECSDVLINKPDLAIIAHNEDGNVSLQGRVFLVDAILPGGVSFVAYTYAGELPTCAFGFNNCGVAFTLNAVPPDISEVVAGGIGRNFVSRDLLESTSLFDALQRLRVRNLSAGHSYNLMDISSKKMFNIETASEGRCSVLEISEQPYFHANMYLRLDVSQVPNESSIQRQKRADVMEMSSMDEILLVLGDQSNGEYPIYMTGPQLCTLCTVVFDMNERRMSLYLGNPKSPHDLFHISLDI